MNRLYDFIRRHPVWVDSLWAGFLLMLSSLWIVASVTGPAS